MTDLTRQMAVDHVLDSTDSAFDPAIVRAAKAAREQGAPYLTVSVEDGVVIARSSFTKAAAGPVMVALAFDEVEPDVRGVAPQIGAPVDRTHLTLAYCGRVEEMTVAQLAALHAAVARMAEYTDPVSGELGGLGLFPPGDAGTPVWVPFDSTDVTMLRNRVENALLDWGVPMSRNHGFVPHVTVGYVARGRSLPPMRPMPPRQVTLDAVYVAVAGEWTRYPLGEEQMVGTAKAVAMTKAQARKATEDRFTLAPWYVPNRVDAHGEWTDPDEVQRALWKYVDDADRDIRLQHDRDIVAGRWVEAMSWPHEVEVPMFLDGEVRNQRFPEGTVFLGVKWEPWAWELVKAGHIRGYSIGGHAQRVTVDIPQEAME